MSTVSASWSGLPLETAEQWFKDPIQTIDVTLTGVFSPTADGACPVCFDGTRSAFVKPRPGPENKLLVAREKISSDLAYLLGLPVAPVVVRCPMAPDWPNYTAMSLVVSSSARLWGAGGDKHIAIAAEILEHLRVFWTWIGDTDHNNHPGNLLFMVNGSKIELCAIDHAFTLCRQCHPDPLAVPACTGYGTVTLSGREAWTRAQIAK